MKRIIQTCVVAVICILAFQVKALADNDKPIAVSQLPTVSQQIIKKHFSGKKVAMAKQETGLLEKNYEVVFTSGEKIEFDKRGAWKEIDCKLSAVPAKLIPAKIASYLKANYPGVKVLKLEKDNNEYEVDLANGIEIKFNKNFVVIDID
mgnify:FL=1